MPPTSQKLRPIALDLDGERVELTLRPEDLQWSEPSRTAVIQTLGNAWMDSFGPGVATITIAGNSGWSGRRGAKGFFDDDWLEAFYNLHRTAFTNWHAKVAATKDPQDVLLLFIDVLDERVVRVVPNTFVLRRNKGRPLLMQYTISFLVVKDLGVIRGESDDDDDPADGGGDFDLPDDLPDDGSGDDDDLRQLTALDDVVARLRRRLSL